MITIIADDKIPFLRGALEPYASVVYLDGPKINASAIQNADALLIRTRTVCNESTLDPPRARVEGDRGFVSLEQLLKESDPVIILDCHDQSPEWLACQAILHTYNVKSDDFRLRSNLGEFEKQRGQYPVRREFSAYRIILLNGNSRTVEIMEAMGFMVIEMKK